MKREERHELKRNDLAVLMEEAAHYATHHVRRVALIGVGVVLLGAGVFGGRAYLAARDATAARQLGALMEVYNAPITASLEDLERAQTGVPTFTSVEARDRKVLDMAAALLTSGARGSALAGALLYRGIAQVSLKQSADAEASFRSVIESDPDGLFGPVARLRLARLLESQGKAADALPLYQAMADATDGLLPREEGLIGMARCHEALGRRSEALGIYRRLTAEFPESEYLAEARTHLADAS